MLIDPHTHINPHCAGLDDAGRHPGLSLLHRAGPFGRHAASRGSKSRGSIPKEKVGRLVEWLGALENTIQSSWLIEMAQDVLRLSRTSAITPANWEALYDRAAAAMAAPDWAAQVLQAEQAGSRVSDQRF